MQRMVRWKGWLAGLLSAATLAGALTAFATPKAAEATHATVAVKAPDLLFSVARSKNSNVLVYELRGGNGAIDVKEPVRAKWIMLEKDGHEEGLTKLEQRAYGVKVLSASPSEAKIALAALPDREVTVRNGPDGPEAIMEIDGVPSRLESIFVESKEGIFPKVKWVDVSGVSLADGSAVTERITP
ncbi:hypothetical protein AKJ08_3579 [Vulgatibacter incomptus]|uniref:DUF4833 domain-containing protein n=2 Tax=Vulgatibacter incomptus TaxID=1391653 RepID=A0A0K1PI47_9BACT|nr:hypothetical protein AKJ08_3579 [Vulgatibacter incomptus]